MFTCVLLDRIIQSGVSSLKEKSVRVDIKAAFLQISVGYSWDIDTKANSHYHES